MKVFTLDEANSVIETYRKDILSLTRFYRQIDELGEASRQAAANAKNGGGGMIGGTKYVENLYEIGRLITALTAEGIQIKDPRRGLIDFPSFRNGKLVLLCWEPSDGNKISFWHDVESGYAGRQPI
ncbi:MAG TPA: DUF2203 domain-containing protein [Pyrinomonadaceae bacterium]|jgi:hypothetical protein|nr:DUF2203 domain-containing protein [Pyrinomonadaceae bacterium]